MVAASHDIEHMAVRQRGRVCGSQLVSVQAILKHPLLCNQSLVVRSQFVDVILMLRNFQVLLIAEFHLH